MVVLGESNISRGGTQCKKFQHHCPVKVIYGAGLEDDQGAGPALGARQTGRATLEIGDVGWTTLAGAAGGFSGAGQLSLCATSSYGDQAFFMGLHGTP